MDGLSYRELQAYAKALKLPGNMKYQVLWDLVQARKSGNERLVSLLLAEQNRIRVTRRINRKSAKIQAETLERLFRQEDTNNAALQYNVNHEKLNRVSPPNEPQISAVETKLSVASLLDEQTRYNVMMAEKQFCRNAVSTLPVRTHTVYNQFPGFNYLPTTAGNQQSMPVGMLTDPVKLQQFAEIGNGDDTVNHIEVVTTDFRARSSQFKLEEPKKSSFQIEDIMASSSSTPYPQGYSNNCPVNFNNYVSCTRNRMGKFNPPPGEIPQESLDPWRKQYMDINTTEFDAVSSNDSQSSLHIDTAGMSPMSSETLSANETCEDTTVNNNFELDMTAEVSLQPAYQTLASNFLSTLDSSGLRGADTRERYPHVIEEITCQPTDPPHMATVVFPKPDPLELKNSTDELTDDPDSKILDGLKHLHKSLGIHITTENLGAFDEAQTACDSFSVEEEVSVPGAQEPQIDKYSPEEPN